MIMNNICICVVGLGYVGLPLAVEFSKHHRVIGFDIDTDRIQDLVNGVDKTGEVSSEVLGDAKGLTFTSDTSEIAEANTYIITVPTPVDKFRVPNLKPLENATRMIAHCLSAGDLVIYESTVYPGVTREFCGTILENKTGFRISEDIYLGYSPERINPGDKINTISNIIKVTSGCCPESAQIVNKLYSKIISAGTYLASSIEEAEAAKVIENTQRDVNIALINELALLFHKIGLDTESVLSAARTKWNFLDFKPGLVGGHCIGVDPFYLTHRAREVGFNPEMILAGRRINDAMASYCAEMLVKKIRDTSSDTASKKIAVLGATFKENCPDLRNSKVFEFVNSLTEFGYQVIVIDPHADQAEAMRTYCVDIRKSVPRDEYCAICLMVPHLEFISEGANALREYSSTQTIFFDLKSIFPKSLSDLRL